MNSLKTDPLNTFLIFLSFGLAYIFPFELFIMSYAILGPLHYLTEINWVRDQKYFVANKSWVYIVITLAALISIRIITKLPFLSLIAEKSFIKDTILYLHYYSNNLFFITLVIAFTFLFFKKTKQQVIIVIIGILVMFLLNKFSIYKILMGVFLPTLIHVYVFTLLFMWYGNSKNKSTIGLLNILLLIAVPFLLIFIPIDNMIYHFSDTIKTIVLENNFYILNTSVSKLFGINDGTTFFFYETLDIKIQIFIAFAYTYHYLNWFSKTTVIGWHKTITKKKSIVILSFWVISISLYFYNYTLGLSLLLFLSVLHVLMEFPLNIITIKSLIQNLSKKTN
jgi:hypothetical protein